MNDFMKRHQEEQDYRAYMTRRIDELSHGNSSDCTTEEILQIASQLDDGERINCTPEITPNIELEVNISNRLQEDARVMLNWHTTDKRISGSITLSITTPFLPDETWTRTFGDLPVNVQAANDLASQDPLTAAFIKAEADATPTPFTGEWGPPEVALAGVSSKLANEVATNRYDPSHIKPLLDQANQQIQSGLH